MKLYGYYRSSASYRIRIILNVKGIAWENQPVMLNRDEHRAGTFKAINPTGFVPVLDTGEAILAQSAAIAEYLEETVPAPPLLPEQPVLRAQVRELQHLHPGASKKLNDQNQPFPALLPGHGPGWWGYKHRHNGSLSVFS